MLLKLRYYGDPFLRKHCREIHEVNDEIRQLAKDMIETMHSVNGVGLAAPQVGVDLRMFVSALSEDGHLTAPEVFINPKIIEVSEEGWVETEGCISIPGVYEEFERPTWVTMEAMNLEGKTFQRTGKSWRGRNLLHENDHLNGVLTIDRVGKLRRRQLEPVLKRIKKKYIVK